MAELFAPVVVPDTAEMERPGVRRFVDAMLQFRVDELRMANLRVRRRRSWGNLFVTSHGIEIDSRGWTGR